MFEKDAIVKLKNDRWCLGAVDSCTATHAIVLTAKFLKGLDGENFAIEQSMKVPLEQLEIVMNDVLC